MAVFKCKMCGGTIEFEEGASIGVCDHCGTKQTLPKFCDGDMADLYDRANDFRRNNEYDNAMEIYKKILEEDRTDAEAYWSLVLCKYGIEYIEDPASHRRVPTVNRAQRTSIYSDEDYKSAIKYADEYQKDLYEKEAKAINEIQEGILEISNKEDLSDTKNDSQKAEIERKDAAYSAGIKKQEEDSVSSLENAIKIFEGISGYRDSESKIYACQSRIKELKRIATEKAAKKRKRLIAITTSVMCVCIAFIIVLTTVIIPNRNNNKVANNVESGVKENETEKAKTANVGDSIYFGSYEQDNNTSNGTERIEWVVLAKEDNKAFVISKYCLDYQLYNISDTYSSVTWETCSLRSWLNETFYNSAFTDEEKAKIETTNVINSENHEFRASGGNNTTDKVFLLSIDEAEKYFPSDEERKASSTEYAVSLDDRRSDYDYTASGEATSAWWLRTPGDCSLLAAFVGTGGGIGDRGSYVHYIGFSVRPALWISL